MSNSTRSQQQTRRLHFSLRELMLLVVMLGAFFALIFSHPHQQRRAVDAIRGLGGTVEHSIGDGRGVPVQVEQITSAWARRILGERSTRVATIDLSRSTVTDSGLEVMTCLTDTRVIDLSRTAINGTGLTVLQSMPQIHELDLQSTETIDTSLSNLKSLARLEYLNLDNTPLSGTGLRELSALPCLRHLSLRNTQIGDDSLAYLGGLQQLVELHLDNTQVTDAGLVHLRRCLHLQVLSLENTQVSVAGLSQLKGLVGLKDLQALGLDLAVDELSDIDALQQKWQYTTRSRVTSNPLLLGEILRAWKERQERLISFDIQSVGVQTERNTSFNVVQECVVDSQGHVRYSYSASTPIRTSFVTAFDGRTTKSLTTDPAGDYPFATERPGSTDWSRDRTVYPITVALRPFADLFGEADLVVTDDEELINGCNCVVMYHPDGKVWVDASRDYVPLRYSFIRRGLTLFQIDISFQKDDKVGWVPAAWTYVNFGRDGNVTMGTEITISECSFNEAIAWDVFQIAYPSNTRVTDHVTGTRYIVSTNGTRQVLGRIPP